jgi:hypothetical protein
MCCIILADYGIVCVVFYRLLNRRLPRKKKEILKGPKHEKFVAGNFTQIKPVWTGELEIGQNFKNNGWGLIFFVHWQNICLAISAAVHEKFVLFSYVEKNVVLDCFYIHFNRPRKIF